MGYLGRRIGKSQDTGNPTADGTGAGILDLFTNGYFQRQGNVFNTPGASGFGPPQGLTATGGVISDYEVTSSGITTVYRAHIFTSTGTFQVTGLSATYPADVEYLVVAGGGGGGYNAGGGGGAGGFRTNVSGHPLSSGSPFPVSTPTSYPITIGAGGSRSPSSNASPTRGGNGGPSVLTHPSAPLTITSQGGGAGGGRDGSPPHSFGPGVNGGSGGGGAGINPPTASGGTGNRETGTSTPVPSQGFDGGTGGTYPVGGGGGGGATSVGANAIIDQGGAGGIGTSISITGISTHYAGGGGGADNNATGGAGGVGGGGAGGSNSPGNGIDGTYSTGGGGGGGGQGGAGGSGIVVVRYQIGQLTAAAKATGGAISYYDGKTIHTFTSTGAFQVTNGPISGETLIVAGGGGAGYYGGGGGAGGLLWYGSPTPTKTANGSAITYLNSTTYPISVGAGGASVGPYSIAPKRGNSGTATVVTHPSGPYSATEGGGGGGNDGGNLADHSGRPGGSGGGASNQNFPAGAVGPGVPGQGNPGGLATGLYNPNEGGGGGGAGGAGTAGGSGSHGGIGLQFSTFGNIGAGAPGPGGGTGWFAGGGGGGGSASGVGGGPGGPYAGGGDANTSSAPKNGRQSTGGGGGSTLEPTITGTGGSGIVIIAYPT